MPATPDDARRQLQRLTSSAVFTSSGRLRRFLEFVVERTLAGEGERLKEYVIGIEVFERNADYDPRLDSIVRVEAARLRSKLAEYYAGEGRADPIVLSLPKGGYAPVISLVEPTPAAPTPVAAAVAPMPEGAPRRASRRIWSLAAAAAVLVVAIAVGVTVPWTAENAPRLRVAVMPFETYSTVPGDKVLATLLTDRVTSELVRLNAFDVVASSTARAVAAAELRVSNIATALHAEVIVQSNIGFEGEGLRVDTRAVSGTLEQKFWVQTFHGDAKDLDALAREIAGELAKVRYEPPR